MYEIWSCLLTLNHFMWYTAFKNLSATQKSTVVRSFVEYNILYFNIRLSCVYKNPKWQLLGDMLRMRISNSRLSVTFCFAWCALEFVYSPKNIVM